MRNSTPALDATPYGNELILQFAEKAIVAEKLGTGPKMDLLTVSFSSNDYVGHALGAESDESHDMALRVDKLVGELIRAAEAQAGVGRVLVVLTADHGVAPVPETNQKRKMPGGRFDEKAELDTVEKALTARFGLRRTSGSVLERRLAVFHRSEHRATWPRWSVSPPTRFARCRMYFASIRARS